MSASHTSGLIGARYIQIENGMLCAGLVAGISGRTQGQALSALCKPNRAGAGLFLNHRNKQSSISFAQFGRKPETLRRVIAIDQKKFGRECHDAGCVVTMFVVRGSQTMQKTKNSPDTPDPGSPAAARADQPASRRHASILATSLDIDLFCRILTHETADAIVYADVGGMIRFWNRGAERIFGYTADEALGKSLDIIIPAELRVRHWEAYGQTMRTGKTRYGDGEVLAVPGLQKAGTTVPIEFTLLPFHDHEGHPIGVAAILRDASRHVEQIEALRKKMGTPPGKEGGDDIIQR